MSTSTTARRIDLYTFGSGALALAALELATVKRPSDAATVRAALALGHEGIDEDAAARRFHAAAHRHGIPMPGGKALAAAFAAAVDEGRATIPYGDGDRVLIAVEAGTCVRSLAATVRAAEARWVAALAVADAALERRTSLAVREAAARRRALAEAREAAALERRRTVWEAAAERIACDERLALPVRSSAA